MSIWLSSGSLIPDYIWQSIGGPVTGDLLKLSFSATNGGAIDPLFSFVLLRRNWQPSLGYSASENIAGKFRAQKDPLILYVPITAAHKNAGLDIAQYECRLFRFQRDFYLEEPEYSIVLEWQ